MILKVRNIPPAGAHISKMSISEQDRIASERARIMEQYKPKFLGRFPNGCCICTVMWRTEEELLEILSHMFNQASIREVEELLVRDFEAISKKVEAWVNVFLWEFSGGVVFGENWTNKEELTAILCRNVESVEETEVKFQREYIVCVNKSKLDQLLNEMIDFITRETIDNNYICLWDIIPGFLWGKLHEIDTTNFAQFRDLVVLVFTDTNKYMSYEELTDFITKSKTFVENVISEHAPKRRRV